MNQDQYLAFNTKIKATKVYLKVFDSLDMLKSNDWAFFYTYPIRMIIVKLIWVQGLAKINCSHWKF